MILGRPIGNMEESAVVAGWRARRYRLFEQLCIRSGTDSIIDLGSGDGSALERFNTTNPITAIDLIPQQTQWFGKNVTLAEGDATELDFSDFSFDAAFSNSVIEHIPPGLQKRYADETRRVARRYFVQTPNRWFPVEAHSHLPLVHFLPDPLVRWWNRSHWVGTVPPGEWEEIHLLTSRKLRKLFPDARIYRERLFGLTKSLIAFRA
jgi:hypothetical protein